MRADFLAILAVAAAAHAGALALWQPRFSGGEAEGREITVSARAASGELAELVEAWNTPPETGDAAELGDTRAEAARHGTEDAAAADAEVAALDAVADLGPVSGPGKEAKRPIFAPPPSTTTAPPPQLALRAPEPQAFSPPGLSAPDSSGPSLGAIGGGPGASPGGSLAMPGAEMGPGGGLALPSAPVEESFAPETSPLPRERPIGLAAGIGAGAGAIGPGPVAAPASPGGGFGFGSGGSIGGPAMPGAAMPGALPGGLPRALPRVPPPLPEEDEDEQGRREANDDPASAPALPGALPAVTSPDL